eukprot:Rmarinus@m.23294
MGTEQETLSLIEANVSTIFASTCSFESSHRAPTVLQNQNESSGWVREDLLSGEKCSDSLARYQQAAEKFSNTFEIEFQPWLARLRQPYLSGVGQAVASIQQGWHQASGFVKDCEAIASDGEKRVAYTRS